ncbi:hypothetical protein HYDPIDRAFT_118751 [Hydnomerulius pinastri MD-312]|uniref:Uncharacterized protein n=1 Tax=Hydnomerulius pinastri MD-312 TaxID=994086 RepID=A0A0C9W8A6_9AGAM|nr:hypothetical protein HYDPIDRAFT_118751 [Hydnomerulius pinastri MD-312]
MLRSSSGSQAIGSDVIRRNLPLIAYLERYLRYIAVDEIKEKLDAASLKYPRAAELVLDMDTTIFPYQFDFLPLSDHSEPYMKDPAWTLVLDAFGSQGSADRSPLTFIKVKQGSQEHVLLSPAKTLNFLAGWNVWSNHPSPYLFAHLMREILLTITIPSACMYVPLGSVAERG